MGKTHREYVDDALNTLFSRAMREAVELERLVRAGEISPADMAHDIRQIVADAVDVAANRIHTTVDEVTAA